jgi:hypothetical protein
MFHTTSQIRRPRRLIATIAIAVAALVFSACTDGGSSDATVPISTSTAAPAEGPSVGYVRATWKQELDVQCANPETIDNGGSDSAVIEIWGPTDEGRYRADMIAPNGRTETVIADVGDDGRVIESWGTYQLAYPPSADKSFNDLTAFRIVDCVLSTANSRMSHTVSNGPYSPGRIPFAHLIPVGEQRAVDVVETLPVMATERRVDTWMGEQFDVFIIDPEPPPGITSVQRSEFWVSQATGLVGRYLWSGQSNRTGSFEGAVEFVERGTRALDSVKFNPFGLEHVTDRFDLPDDAGATADG